MELIEMKLNLFYIHEGRLCLECLINIRVKSIWKIKNILPCIVPFYTQFQNPSTLIGNETSDRLLNTDFNDNSFFTEYLVDSITRSFFPNENILLQPRLQ